MRDERVSEFEDRLLGIIQFVQMWKWNFLQQTCFKKKINIIDKFLARLTD